MGKKKFIKPPVSGRERECVRRGFCRREKFICVVGVDVLGDPCDQRDRSAVGVEKEGVFVGETNGRSKPLPYR